ncbi:MAG: ribonuclease HII [Saprospiraceae bacterium]|nr:ribonuclease HII [Saprospiraceae bacterium]
MLLTFFDKTKIEAGCDEAGRGPLAGPVFAAAVIWPPDTKNDLIRDSKLLNEKKRLLLRDFIMKKAVSFTVAMVDNYEIDSINILNASIKAMHLALDGLDRDFNFILVDGNRFRQYKSINHLTIIKGDNKYLSIAAASILAKTFRDEYMTELNEQYPQYGWKNNKGYATKYHIEAIRKFGITDYHRKTFCSSYKYQQTFLF